MQTLFKWLCNIAIYVLLAHGLAREQGKNFGDDIASAIRLAKKKVLRIDNSLVNYTLL